MDLDLRMRSLIMAGSRKAKEKWSQLHATTTHWYNGKERVKIPRKTTGFDAYLQVPPEAFITDNWYENNKYSHDRISKKIILHRPLPSQSSLPQLLVYLFGLWLSFTGNNLYIFDWDSKDWVAQSLGCIREPDPRFGGISCWLQQAWLLLFWAIDSFIDISSRGTNGASCIFGSLLLFFVRLALQLRWSWKTQATPSNDLWFYRGRAKFLPREVDESTLSIWPQNKKWFSIDPVLRPQESPYLALLPETALGLVRFGSQ